MFWNKDNLLLMLFSILSTICCSELDEKILAGLYQVYLGVPWYGGQEGGAAKPDTEHNILHLLLENIKTSWGWAVPSSV